MPVTFVANNVLQDVKFVVLFKLMTEVMQDINFALFNLKTTILAYKKYNKVFPMFHVAHSRNLRNVTFVGNDLIYAMNNVVYSSS